jgi:hypothetical protein
MRQSPVYSASVVEVDVPWRVVNSELAAAQHFTDGDAGNNEDSH